MPQLWNVLSKAKKRRPSVIKDESEVYRKGFRQSPRPSSRRCRRSNGFDLKRNFAAVRKKIQSQPSTYFQKCWHDEAIFFHGGCAFQARGRRKEKHQIPRLNLPHSNKNWLKGESMIGWGQIRLESIGKATKKYQESDLLKDPFEQQRLG